MTLPRKFELRANAKKSKTLAFRQSGKEIQETILTKKRFLLQTKKQYEADKKKNTYIRAPSGDYIIEKRVLLQSSSIDNQS